MPFTTNTQIKGPAGDPGADGLGYIDADLGGTDNKHLVITDSKNAPHDVGPVVGPAGANGADAVIRGSVATVGDLTALVATAAEGDAYIVEADRHLYRFDGSQFIDAGGMAGPKGDPGSNGTDGARGVSWSAGVGAPTDTTGLIAGDHYLDVSTGQIYTFTPDGSASTPPDAAYRLYPVDTTFWVLPGDNTGFLGSAPSVKVRFSSDSDADAVFATLYDLLDPAPVKAHEHLTNGTLSNGQLYYVRVEDGVNSPVDLTVTPGDGGQSAPAAGAIHLEPTISGFRVIEDAPYTGAEFYVVAYTFNGETRRAYSQTLPMTVTGVGDSTAITGIRFWAVNHADEIQEYPADITTDGFS